MVLLKTILKPGQKMKNPCQFLAQRLAFFFLAGILAIPNPLIAQEKPNLTLDEILTQLQKNLQDYDSKIPSFFCREQVISQLVYGQHHRHEQHTITESIFRLKREDGADRQTTLTESREIVTVNGSPTNQKDLHGPAILSGVFSKGLNAVSLDQESCMRYTLQPPSSKTPEGPYIVQFATIPDHQTNCVLQEEATGRVFVDRASMQVVRMELTAPHHEIAPGYFGLWTIAIDYLPVQLGENTFWLPKTIISTLQPKDESSTQWSFNAGYKDYHKLDVTFRILPFESPTIPKSK